MNVVELLKENNLKIAVAESFTGGLISSLITDIHGASEVFSLGIVVYSPEEKVRLGVPAALIEEYGVVSAPVAAAMASCVRRRAGADIGISTTGYAEGEKTGGYIGISRENREETFWLDISGLRCEVKQTAAQRALEILLDKKWCL